MSTTHHPCSRCGRGIDNRYSFRICTRCSIRPIAKELARRERHKAALRSARSKKAARTRKRRQTTRVA